MKLNVQVLRTFTSSAVHADVGVPRPYQRSLEGITSSSYYCLVFLFSVAKWNAALCALDGVVARGHGG